MWKPLLRLNFNKILLTYKIIQQTLEVKRQQFYIYIYIYIADDSKSQQLHVSASNRPSSGCTSKENSWEAVQCNFCLITRSCSSYHIRGVSKKFGEWYQKTSKTEDTNELTLLAFKIIVILHNTLLVTFIKILEIVSKGLCKNRLQNRCHTFLDCRHVCKTCAFHDALQVRKQKEVRWGQIRGVRWMIENGYAALSQELVDTDRTVRRRVIMQQLPLSSPVQPWPNTVDVS